MLQLLVLIVLSVGIINGPSPLQAFTIETTSCNSTDFTDGNCTLECKVNVTDTSTTQLKSCSWDYYTINDIQNYTFYDGVDLQVGADTYTASLTLTNYSAGNYRCILTLSTDETLTNIFQIDNKINGVDLNNPCNDSSECLTLNAVCEDNGKNATLCQCKGYMNISVYYVPACLAHQENGSHCNVIDECRVYTESYDCVDTYCACTGEMVDVSKDDTDAPKCIAPEWLMDGCYYDEQCTMRADHSFCDYTSNSCECVSPYIMYMPPGVPHKDMYCYSAGTTFSPSAVNIVSVAIVGGLINYMIRRRN